MHISIYSVNIFIKGHLILGKFEGNWWHFVQNVAKKTCPKNHAYNAKNNFGFIHGDNVSEAHGWHNTNKKIKSVQILNKSRGVLYLNIY